MIKKIAKFTLILFICIDVFIIYKVIYTYVNIENQKKESTCIIGKTKCTKSQNEKYIFWTEKHGAKILKKHGVYPCFFAYIG